MKRRTRDEIVNEVTKALEKGELSINEVARKIKANWSTTHRALDLLKKLGIVEETITTPKIRIFRLVTRK